VYGIPGALFYKRASRLSVKITFATATEANNAILKLASHEKVSAIIPEASIYHFGIISNVLPDFSEEELFKNIIHQSQNISTVRQIKRFSDGTLVTTFSVELKFNGNQLPDKISINGLHFKVYPSISAQTKTVFQMPKTRPWCI